MATNYNFTTLTPTFSNVTTYAYGINDLGQIVGYYTTSGGGQHAFVDNNGTYITLDDTTPTSSGSVTPGVTAMAAYAINDQGEISGSETFDGGSWGFVYGGGSTNSNYDNGIYYDVYVPTGDVEASTTTGRGINNEGEMVGGAIFTAGDNPGSGTFGYTISFAFADGSVGALGESFHAFRGATPTILKDPSAGSGGTTATGVNDQGQVTGYYIGTDSNQPNVTTAHGFLYTNGAYSFFDDPNAVNGTFAEGMNNANQIVGYYVDANGKDHGFIFNQPTGTFTTVDVPGASNTFIYGISNNGQLVGDYVNSQGQELPFVATPPNPAPPAATTADLIMSQASTGDYEIYDLGNNTVLAGYLLTNIGAPWQVIGLGDFSGTTDTSDMVLQNASTGALEIEDVSNNNASGPFSLGGVGSEWAVAGVGDFSGHANETDLMMRDVNNGAFEVYDISNSTLASASSLGGVGLEWTVAGVGDFSGNANETDLLLRDSNNGNFEVYDIRNNTIASAASMGGVGLDWQVDGIANYQATGTAGAASGGASVSSGAGAGAVGSSPIESFMAPTDAAPGAQVPAPIFAASEAASMLGASLSQHA